MEESPEYKEWQKAKLEEAREFGQLQSLCSRLGKERDNFQSIAEKLWQLLDNISTASDMYKPRDEKSYKAFYRYAMKMCEKRGKYLYSPDGMTLVLTKD